jgi:hypothetical protein
MPTTQFALISTSCPAEAGVPSPASVCIPALRAVDVDAMPDGVGLNCRISLDERR